ncbi:hypothetical protein VPHD148_0020 [Vibrio phage D148]
MNKKSAYLTRFARKLNKRLITKGDDMRSIDRYDLAKRIEKHTSKPKV